jgi:hypothetical protein
MKSETTTQNMGFTVTTKKIKSRHLSGKAYPLQVQSKHFIYRLHPTIQCGLSVLQSLCHVSIYVQYCVRYTTLPILCFNYNNALSHNWRLPPLQLLCIFLLQSFAMPRVTPHCTTYYSFVLQMIFCHLHVMKIILVYLMKTKIIF